MLQRNSKNGHLCQVKNRWKIEPSRYFACLILLKIISTSTVRNQVFRNILVSDKGGENDSVYPGAGILG